MKNVVYVVTATDAMDYEQGNFGEKIRCSKVDQGTTNRTKRMAKIDKRYIHV